jgi:hypothetical protein
MLNTIEPEEKTVLAEVRSNMGLLQENDVMPI